MASNEILLGAAGARQGKVIFQNGKLRLQAGTAPAFTDYITIDSAGLITLPTALGSTSGLKLGTVSTLSTSATGLLVSSTGATSLDIGEQNVGSGGSAINMLGAAAQTTKSVLSLSNQNVLTLFANGGIIIYNIPGGTDDHVATTVKFSGGAANGQRLNVKTVTGTKTTNSGTGTETVTGVIPAGSLVLGVSIRVTTILAGAALTTFQIGSGATLNRWGATIAIDANTTTTIADFLATTGPIYFQAASDLVFTANAGVFSSGVIRYTIHYLDLTAASS